MALFIVVLTPGLTYVTCRSIKTILVLVSITISIIDLLFISLTRLGCIDSGSQGGVFLLPLLLVILAAVFFFLQQAFADNSELFEQGRAVGVDNDLETQGLGSFIQKSFID